MHVHDPLDVPDPGGQQTKLYGLIERARRMRAGYIFIKVELTPDLREKLERVPEVDVLKFWRVHKGKEYTLIQLRFVGNAD